MLSIPCLVMPWRLQEPRHQQAWYWSPKPEYSISSIRRVNNISWFINSLVPGRCGCNHKNAIFKCVLVVDIFRSSYESLLRWMLENLFDDKSTLVQVTFTWANVDQIFGDIWPHYATMNSKVIVYLPYFHKSQIIFYFSSSCWKLILNMRKMF